MLKQGRFIEDFGESVLPAVWSGLPTSIMPGPRSVSNEFFVSAFGSRDLDAANLRIPLLEFLPVNDYRVQGTIDRTIERLTENGLVIAR